MYEIAKQICDRYNIPFQMLLPLIQETAQKVQYLSPSDAQTGPAKEMTYQPSKITYICWKNHTRKYIIY